MNVSFTKKQEKYISSLIESGDYQNASEAVRDAIRLHQIYREKILDDLRAEIEKGWHSQNSQRNVQDIIATKAKEHKAMIDHYVLSEAADQDLEDIFDYTAREFGFTKAV